MNKLKRWNLEHWKKHAVMMQTRMAHRCAKMVLLSFMLALKNKTKKTIARMFVKLWFYVCMIKGALTKKHLRTTVATTSSFPKGFLTKDPESRIYEKFAVSSELPVASEIGRKIFEKGGSSVDAAIATCLAVGVVNSFSSGIGGGGFMLIKKRGTKENAIMIDFRETSPVNFNIDKVIEGNKNHTTTGMVIGVPCEIKGLYQAHKMYGKLSWADLFDESIKLCDGFEVSRELAKRLKKYQKEILMDPGLAHTYSTNGVIKKRGDIVKRLNYKKTLEYIKHNPNAFDEGWIVDSLVSFINQQGGDMSASDFKANQPRVIAPLVDKYKDYTVYTTNLPSSGVLVIEALKILEKIDIQSIYNDSIRQGNSAYIHILAEVCKFVMARRGELGDPKLFKDSMRVVNNLRNKENIEYITEKLKSTKSISQEEYRPFKYNTVDHGTTHINTYSTVDNIAVLTTSTVNDNFGFLKQDPVTGIIVNDQLRDFYYPKSTRDKYHSNHIPNLARPSQIPLSSASPIILEKNDELIMLGAAGGIRIVTSIIGVLYWLNLGFDMMNAINKPRLHHQYDPNIVYVENTEDPAIIDYLRSRGHVVQVSDLNSTFTSVQGIYVKGRGADVKINAVSDRRKGGLPAGV